MRRKISGLQGRSSSRQSKDGMACTRSHGSIFAHLFPGSCSAMSRQYLNVAVEAGNCYKSDSRPLPETLLLNMEELSTPLALI